MRVRLRVGLCLLAFCACADDGAAARGDHELEGTVSDEFTQRGVGGATVRFVSDALDRAETVSEPDGRFSLQVEVTEGVRFGTLEASRAGYADSAKASVYFDGSIPRAALRMRPKN